VAPREASASVEKNQSKKTGFSGRCVCFLSGGNGRPQVAMTAVVQRLGGGTAGGDLRGGGNRMNCEIWRERLDLGDASAVKVGGDSRAQEDVDMAGTPAQASTVDPVKWLAIVRRWCPAAPVEIPITLVKSLIEAAASGSSGQLRLGLLDDFVLGLDVKLCSNAQKLNKLKKETVRMAADPLRRPNLRPGHPAELARAALAAVERAPDQVLSVEKIHTALRRVKPKIRRTSTYALVKRMTDCGWFERDFAGVYGLPSRTRKPYEARTLQLLRLVYTAPGHEMGTAEARAVFGWSPKLLGATASELCSRKLLVKPGKGPRKVFKVPAVDKLERGEGPSSSPPVKCSMRDRAVRRLIIRHW
jgi:hypothetical protein